MFFFLRKLSVPRTSTATLLVTLCAMSAQAQDTNAENGCFVQTDKKITQVYFGNGILTTFDKAKITKELIERAYKQALESLRDNQPNFADETYEFNTAYNPTQGEGIDVMQVLLQKSQEAGLVDLGLSQEQVVQWVLSNGDSAFIRAALRAEIGRGTEDTDFIDTLLGRLSDEQREAIRAEAIEITLEALLDNAETQAEHVAEYKSVLDDGGRVIVISHSQGNLFANNAVDEVVSETNKPGSIGVYGVATPASRVANGGSYVTANDDIVINIARALPLASSTLSPLPGNLQNGLSPLGSDDSIREATGHFFDESYFQETLPSRERIDQGVKSLATDLEFPKTEPINDDGTAIQLVAETSGPVFGTGFVRLQPGVIPEGGRFSSLISSVEGDRFSASNNPSRQVLSISCDEVVEGDYFIRSDAVLLNTEPYVRPPSVAFVPPKMTMSLTLGDGQVFEPRDVVFFRRAFPVSDFNEFQYATEGYRITVDRNVETGKLEFDATLTGN